MKIFPVVTIFIFLLASFLLSKELAADSSKAEKSVSPQKIVKKETSKTVNPESPKAAVPDTSAKGKGVVKGNENTAKQAPSPADDKEFDNPFVTDDDRKESVTQNDTNAADTSASQSVIQQQSIQGDSFEKDEIKRIDIIVDLGIGMSIPRFEVEPGNISTAGKLKFIFNPGIIFPIGKRFYTQIALRYLQLTFELNQDDRIFSPGQTTYININTRESLTFITLPLLFGMRFEVGPITPYLFGDIEPAFLSSGHQFSKQTRSVYYDNGGKYFDTLNYDIDISKIREQLQVFIGGGIGLEFSYGYGMVYIDGSLQYALNRVDKPDDTRSRPLRTSCKAFYFPISLGVRFYL